MDGYATAVEREVLGWPGVTVEPGRFGSTVFRYGRREIGHLHRDGIADIPVPRDLREELLAAGRARPHRAGSGGYVSYPIGDREDASALLEILGANYERAKDAAERVADRRAREAREQL